jgi:hypothetical protein
VGEDTRLEFLAGKRNRKELLERFRTAIEAITDGRFEESV